MLRGTATTKRPLAAGGRHKILPAGVISKFRMFTQEGIQGNAKIELQLLSVFT